MVAKKNQYWFKILEPSAMELTFSLSNHEKVNVQGIGGGKGWSKGRFTFRVDEPGLEDVTFQLTTKNKLGIFAPVGLDVNEAVMIVKPIFQEAAGTNVRLEIYFKSGEKKRESKPLASSNTVSRIVEKIDGAINLGNWDLCRYWIEELRHVCLHNRTGHITELLEALNTYTNIPKIFEDDDLRFKLAFMMHYILSNEIESETTENVNQIKESLLDSVCKIALHPWRNSRTRALDFLSNTDEQESVDVVMEILTEPTDQQIDQNSEEFLHHVLFQSHLAKKQKEYIRGKLAELAISRDEVVKSRIKRLQEKYR